MDQMIICPFNALSFLFLQRIPLSSKGCHCGGNNITNLWEPLCHLGNSGRDTVIFVNLHNTRYHTIAQSFRNIRSTLVAVLSATLNSFMQNKMNKTVCHD